MGVKVTLPKMPKIDKAGLRRAFLKAGTKTQERIRRRTRSGYDMYGRRFQAYAPVSSDYKRKMGVKDFKGSRVTLTDSGKMVNSVSYSMISTGFQMFVRDHADIAYYHDVGAGNLPKRQFFGSDKWLRDYYERIFTEAVIKDI